VTLAHEAALPGDYHAGAQLALTKDTLNVTQEDIMLWTVAVVMLVLWVLGLVTSYTIGGFIHILLVLAVISVAFQLINGRRTA